MIIMIIYAIISFMLDGFVSNYINSNSYMMTIYTAISLVIMFSYFDDKKKYIYITIILGILFDVIYNNTFLLNVSIFLIISFVIDKLDYYVTDNCFTVNLKTILAVSIYHVCSYLILLLVHYDGYSLMVLLEILYKSIIMTIIYTTISYLIIKKIYFFKYDKKIK